MSAGLESASKKPKIQEAEESFPVGSMVLIQMKPDEFIKKCWDGRRCFEDNGSDLKSNDDVKCFYKMLDKHSLYWVDDWDKPHNIHGIVSTIDSNTGLYHVRILYFKARPGRDGILEVEPLYLQRLHDHSPEKNKFFEDYVLKSINTMFDRICNRHQNIRGNPIEVEYKIRMTKAMTPPTQGHQYFLEVWRHEIPVVENEILRKRLPGEYQTCLEEADKVVQLVALRQFEIIPQAHKKCTAHLSLMETFLPFRQQGFAKLLTGVVFAFAAISDIGQLTVQPLARAMQQIFDNHLNAPYEGDKNTRKYNIDDTMNPFSTNVVKLWDAFQTLVDDTFYLCDSKLKEGKTRRISRPGPGELLRGDLFKQTDFYFNVQYWQATAEYEKWHRDSLDRDGLPQRFSGAANPYLVLTW